MPDDIEGLEQYVSGLCSKEYMQFETVSNKFMIFFLIYEI